MTLAETEELLVQALRGDREAFSQLHEESFRPVWRFAARHRADRAAAESLTEAILTRAIAHLDERPDALPWAAWLFSLARAELAAPRGERCARSGSAP